MPLPYVKGDAISIEELNALAGWPPKETTPMAYRVVFGETIPAWERIFPTKAEADAFAIEHLSFGDIIFSVKKVVAGEPPRSLMTAIEAERKG